MVSWIEDFKFPVGATIRFGSIMLVANEDGDLIEADHGPAPGESVGISFEFPYDLQSTTFAYQELAWVLGSPWGHRLEMGPSVDPNSSSALQNQIALYILTGQRFPGLSLYSRSDDTSFDDNSCTDEDFSSSGDYPEILGNTRWDLDVEDQRLYMAGRHKSTVVDEVTSKLKIIGSQSHTSPDVPLTPQNLGLEFDGARLQTIMKSMYRLAPGDSPMAPVIKQTMEIAERIGADLMHHTPVQAAASGGQARLLM